MTETTLEEARRCPKCEQPGVAVGIVQASTRDGSGAWREVTPGAKLHRFACDNKRCKWYGQVCRIVQVNPDGSIPQPVARRRKDYPQIPDLTDKVNAELAAQLAAELERGEIRRR